MVNMVDRARICRVLIAQRKPPINVTVMRRGRATGEATRRLFCGYGRSRRAGRHFCLLGPARYAFFFAMATGRIHGVSRFRLFHLGILHLAH